MNKISIFIVSFLFLSSLLIGAEENEKKEEESADKKAKKGQIIKHPKYQVEYINKSIKDFTEKVKSDNKGGTAISSNEFLIFAGMMENYYKYPDVELETQIYRTWYKKMFDALHGMYMSRLNDETAVFMNQKEKSLKYKEEYKKYFTDFKNLIVSKKKYEIPDDKLREMQKKKKEAEEAARKKKNR